MWMSLLLLGPAAAAEDNPADEPQRLEAANNDAEITEEITIQESLRRAVPGERRLSMDDAAMLPGTNGDVVKMVQNLPGVARAPFGTTTLLIRGTGPRQSATLLDGLPLPLVFHFGGLTTVLDSDMLQEVAVVPGNASVRYGRLTGGVVDLRSDTQLPDKAHAKLGFSLLQTSASAEVPVTDNLAVQAAVRRSWIDAVVGPVLDAAGQQARAPRYYDGQLRILSEVGALGTLDVMALGSNDTFAWFGTADAEPMVDLNLRFWQVRARLLGAASPRWRHETAVGFGITDENLVLNTIDQATESAHSLAARHEWLRLPRGQLDLGARLGVDVLGGQESYRYTSPATQWDESSEGPRWTSAVYAELTGRLSILDLSPAVRATRMTLGSIYTDDALEPRLAALVRLGDDWRLRAATGRATQWPETRELDTRADGVAGLAPERARQNSLGAEWRPLGGLWMAGTVFANRLNSLVVGRDGRLEIFDSLPLEVPENTDAYSNKGEGRVYGGELSARWDTAETLVFGALTVSRSERRTGDQDWVLFDYDQPIVFNGLISRALPRSWRLGARVRLGSGNPYSPVAQRVQLIGEHSWVPVYGDRVQERLPPFWSLDLRVDKGWTFDRWRLAASLDLQNATWHRNAEVHAWTWDYSRLSPVRGLPTLPMFGLEARW